MAYHLLGALLDCPKVSPKEPWSPNVEVSPPPHYCPGGQTVLWGGLSRARHGLSRLSDL